MVIFHSYVSLPAGSLFSVECVVETKQRTGLMDDPPGWGLG